MWSARVSGYGGCEFVVGLSTGQGPALELTPEKRKHIAVELFQDEIGYGSGQQKDKEHFYCCPWHPDWAEGK